MLESDYRKTFNAAFKTEVYEALVADIRTSGRNALDFRVCETPFFPTRKLTDELVSAANDIVRQLMSERVWKRLDSAVPPSLAAPNEDAHPQFLQLDFAICEDANGNPLPQLIELQGFPTVFAFQAMLDEKLRRHYPIPSQLTSYFNGLTRETYLAFLKEILLGDSAPENVILLEIEPEKQKTRIDFYATEDYFGVAPVCLTDVKKRGRKLYYRKNGKEIPIERIYNRVIFDELDKKNLSFEFSFQDDLDVKWLNHPNWFMKISKYCLPLFQSKYAPQAYFLADLERYPDDLENYVAKPLFSFSGGGVMIDLTKEDLDKIEDKSNYLLQRKVNYAPAIDTPEGGTKVELRMMFFWRDSDATPTLVNNLVRMSRGKLINTMFNKVQNWTGSNIAYHE
ncbi:MAG: hypothetical protein NZM06_05450 [Chloroherpetonaceae bacterium]|nr:hypothetical protein [Chloroherpetonaceae bacterium]MDW8438070.1 hypothetical protein [Chloroherpetonaceae bacterium]